MILLLKAGNNVGICHYEFNSILAHVARKKETKTNNASAPLIQYRLRTVKSVRKE